MYVYKRTGEKELVQFDKVLRRLKNISEGIDNVNIYEIAQKVCSGIYDGVRTCELDELAAQICSRKILDHPNYDILASRLVISNHQKKTSPSFSETISILYENVDNVTQKWNPLVSKDLYTFVQNNKEKLNNHINYKRDYDFGFFGFKTLENQYLLSINKKTIERPQHMFMRVAIGIHGNDLKDVIETYDNMSTKHFTHATPTLFNAGTKIEQCSSCFLLSMDDSIVGIYDCLKECATISKHAGGIGVCASDIRSQDSIIAGTNGRSNGILPMIQVFNSTARYVNQSGRRNGSFAIYIEPWHGDIECFLNLKKNHGVEDERARDLFYALWIPDLFMKRVKNNDKWSLMCPNVCKNLTTSFGEDFEKLYCEYESKNMYFKQIDAQYLWRQILESQIETGTPYMLYKDHVNKKNNQSNLGTIKCSNLCTEIMEYSNPSDETAVCNLASICLPSFIDIQRNFDFAKLGYVTKIIVKNINKIIDKNFYPSEKARNSNLKHRPIGIGVQGLADLFAIKHVPFDSNEARELNKMIFETIYYNALEESNNLSIKLNKTYDSFKGSPLSYGLFQFDLWNKDVTNERHNWEYLRKQIIKHGVLNSLLIAPMPTASTSQIMGCNEAFEPYTSNVYKRKTYAGEFSLINKYLITDLEKLGLWNTRMKDLIILNEGSIQNITEIPKDIKEIYKTAFELKQKSILEMAADRGPFIDQSQSLNIFLQNPDFSKLSSIHFYGWNLGLKTGMYYLRTKSLAKPQQFTIDPNISKFTNLKPKCNDEICLSCSS